MKPAQKQRRAAMTVGFNFARKITGLALLAATALTACAQEGDGVAAPRAAGAKTSAENADPIAAALANPARPEEDRADDPRRKPDKVLAFIGVKPGMTVFEMEAGRGYYTELFSFLVGENGRIVMQSPPAFDNFLADPIATRLANGRLGNVRASKTNFDDLDAPNNSIDIVTWMLGPHELYFSPPGAGSLGEVEKTYAEVMRILKPGGIFIILDHAAAPGSPHATGGSVHRIDPEIVKGLAAGAGFRLIEQSDILRNPNDRYELSVFDPMVRRKTDRFLLKYQKPQ
jgi:predicted methyltransferase